jgi:BCCIP
MAPKGKNKGRARKARRTDEGSSASAAGSAAASKRDAASDSSSSSSSEEDLVDRLEDDAREDVHVEFETRDPVETDWHSVKRAVGGLFDGDLTVFDAGGLADRILAQTEYVGSVLQAHQHLESDVGDKKAQHGKKQQQQQQEEEASDKKKRKRGEYDAEADTDPQLVGVVSLVNVRDHHDAPFITQAQEFLFDKLKKKASKEQKRGSPASGETSAAEALKTVRELFTDPKSPRLGWWISERLINVPADVAPPLQGSLAREIGWAIEHAAPDKSPFDVDVYLKIVMTYTTPEEPTRQCMHVEDDMWLKHASCKVSWPMQGDEAGRWTLNSPNVTRRRWLVLLPANRLSKVLDELSALVASGEEQQQA